MSIRSQQEEKKRKFVKANRALFDKAYREMGKHRYYDRYGANVMKFVNKARKKFKYAENTAVMDIWWKFVYAL